MARLPSVGQKGPDGLGGVSKIRVTGHATHREHGPQVLLDDI